MKTPKVYVYKQCSTCKKALQFLEKKKVSYTEVPIVDTPPSVAELKKMLGFLKGDFKKLFNTSGLQYRELGMSEKMKTLSAEQAIALLSKNGKLIKRPFFLTESHGAVGFKEDEWKKILG